jgi:hypothetical protein
MEWNLDKPKNQWAKVIKILLIEYVSGTNMAAVLNNHYKNFYKFSTRLGDIERNEKDFIVNKTTVAYTDIDGKPSHYTQYNPLNTRQQLTELYEKLNKDGLVGYSKKRGR